MQGLSIAHVKVAREDEINPGAVHSPGEIAKPPDEVPRGTVRGRCRGMMDDKHAKRVVVSRGIGTGDPRHLVLRKTAT
jgi:hypothetical protein